MSELVVVDASVAVKWLVPEPDAEHAKRLLDGTRVLTAPDFMLLEADNFICKLIRRGQATEAEGDAMRASLRKMPVEYHPFEPLLDSACKFANQTRRSAYDCLYLALSVSLNGELVTADRPFYDEVRLCAPGMKVKWIGEI
ncbi:MAG TPA: type II toxin-antitoxin system VapC family toxin [Planctomycetota bacterium]|jgi:predicted nucleic acid-binding protein